MGVVQPHLYLRSGCSMDSRVPGTMYSSQPQKQVSRFPFRYSPPSSPTSRQYLVSQQCQYYKQQINRNQIKDLHQSFPRLLTVIFGYDGAPGWNLKTCNRKYHTQDFDVVSAFLSPSGEMFQLIAKLDHEGFLYEFPIKCLPQPSQSALMEGVVPPYYQGKVQLSLETTQGVPDHIYLSAFEYYFFHFAYYLIYVQQNSSQVPWTTLQDCLYKSLLDSYLLHFLPPLRPIPNPVSMGTGIYSVGKQSHQSPGIPVQQTPSVQSPISSRSHTPLGLLKMNGAAVTPYRGTEGGGGRVGVYSSVNPHTQNEIPQSEIFLMTLIEFWLNQLTHDTHRGNFLTQTQNMLCFQEFIRLLRMLVKHVLYFANGSSYSVTSPSHSPFPSPMTSITESLRSSVVSVYIQKQVYKFIRHAFQHWPLDDNFRYLLELWLTYIQPWRYTDPNKPSAENKGDLEKVPTRWQMYVTENLPFYSSLLLEFLARSFQLDLTSDIGVTLLFRVTKVFAQPGLSDYISTGEHLLLQSDPSSPHQTVKLSPSSPTDLTFLKALFIDLEGPMFEYHSLFGEETHEAMQLLIITVQQARSRLMAQTQTHTTDPEQDKPRSWFSSLWQDLFDDRDSRFMTTGKTRTDPKKLIDSLETIETNLKGFFDLSIQTVIPTSPSNLFDGSPVLQPIIPMSPSSSHLGVPVQPQLTTPPSTVEAEYHSGTGQLTPEGKEQVIQGIRLCSKSRIITLGDPILQPICTYENSTLVRALYRLSCYLNHKFSNQLFTISTSSNLICKLLLQLLTPPIPSRIHRQTGYEPPSTPTSGVSRGTTHVQRREEQIYRINLRALGSYYTLSYFFLLISILWLFSVPLVIVLIFGFLFVCFYCVLRYTLKR